jgi:acyl-CoA thioesterase I
MRSRTGNRFRSRGRAGRWDRPPAWALILMAICVLGLAAAVVVWPARDHGRPAEAAPLPTEAPQTSPSRAAAVPVERPADRPLRVLFIGDSLMWGSFASDESLTYRALIVAALREDGPVEPVVVGGPGESAAEATEHLGEVTGPIDLVFVEIGANDSVSITPEEFAADYEALLDRVRRLAPEAGLVCDGVWNGRELASGLDRELRPVCAAHEGFVVPLSGLYVDETLRGPEGSAVPGGGVRDQFHPNDAGHAAIAEAMLAVLQL